MGKNFLYCHYLQGLPLFSIRPVNIEIVIFYNLVNVDLFDPKLNTCYQVPDMGKLKNQATPVSGPILLTDIDRFNRIDRSDVDRTAIRTELQSVLGSFLKKCLPAYEKKVIPFDTGDGLGLLFPAETPKKVLLEGFLRLVPSLVKKHNANLKFTAKFLLRATLHFGDYLKDKPKLTKTGYSGREINYAFRLLDSEILREAVRRQGEARPVALILSDEFYTKIVKQQIPNLEKHFVLRTITAKDGEITAWLYVDQVLKFKIPETTIEQPKRSKVDGKGGIQIKKTKSSVKLKDLKPSIYVSAADIHNFNLYKRIAGSVPLVNHLETAILLSDCAILHCTDPYRLQEVFNLLKEFEYFIKIGKIRFLLGSSIESPKRDFIPYINEKASQYNESGHGKADIDSLSQPDPKADVEAVIKMLEMSPFRLHRGYGGTESFLSAVKKDFEQAETLATTADPFSGKLQHSNLTLRQILSLAQIDPNGKATPLVANKRETETIINQLNQRINNRSFSRQILLSLFHEALAGRGLEEPYFDLLEIRTNLLHLKINVGPHTFTEFHPQRDKNSPYDFDHLLDHLGVLGNRAVKGRCGVELVKTLIAEKDDWQRFATHHLRVMADLYARRLGDLDTEPNGYFLQSRNVPAFKKIGKIVNEQWK
jgi:hypothetical protein